MLTMLVKIAQLDKHGLQTRCALDERTVAEYAEAMADGAEFPPVVVFSMPTGRKHFWLADGFHRVEAALRNGQDELWCEIRNGGYIDALRWALGCNAKHGKRITNEDKQNAMQMAWDNRQQLFGGDPSAPLLAQTCGVHRNTALAFISEHGQMPSNVGNQPVQNVLVDGNQLSQNVTVDGGVQPAQNVQVVKMPTRPVIGRNGRVINMPVRPAAVKAPTRPAAPAHVVPTDRFGVEIPVPLQAAFDGDGLAEVYAQISGARTRLRFGLENNVAEFAAVRQDALVQLDNAYSFVKSAQPFCVCRMCQGQGCKACHGRGWQTEDEYERNPRNFKAKGGK